MDPNSLQSLNSFHPGLFVLGIFALVAWSLVWKGWALWKAARNGSKAWFVVMLIINTAGILEILYIFVFGNKPKTDVLPKA